MRAWFGLVVIIVCWMLSFHTSAARVERDNDNIRLYVEGKTFTITVDPTTKNRIFKGKVADHIAFVPERNIIVGWDNGDRLQSKNSSDNAYFLWMPDDVYVPFELPGTDAEAGFIQWQYSLKRDKFVELSIIPDGFIVRKGIDASGILADKTMIFEIWAVDSNDLDEPPYATIDLIDSASGAQSWDLQELHPTWVQLRARSEYFKQGEKVPQTTYHFLPQSFFVQVQSPKQYLQFAQVSEEGHLNAVTLDLTDLTVVNVVEDVLFTHQLPDRYLLNTKDGYRAQVVEYNQRNYPIYENVPFSLGRKTRDPLQYGSLFLSPSPLYSDLYLPLQENGAPLNLGPGFLGVIPLAFDDQPDVRDDYFSLANGWIIATLVEQGDQEVIMWGWASAEFAHIQPALWKDFDLYEDYEATENFRLSRSFHLGSNGRTIVAKYAEGPFWIGEFPDGTFQFYVQPNLIIPGGTFDTPNTYSGKIAPASTYGDAVNNGEGFLETFADDTNDEYTYKLQEIIGRIKANRDGNEKLEQLLAKQQEEEAQRRKARIEAEQREWEIYWAQRDYNRSRLYAAMEFGSLTRRLSNIRTLGSTTRSTKALKTYSNRIRQRIGEGYAPGGG